MSSSSILIVDDEAGVRASLSGVLRDEGYSVDAVESGEAALEQAAGRAYDVVLLDIWLPGMDGIATLERLRDLRGAAQVIMISGHASVEAAVRATKLGAFDFLEKPLTIEKVLVVIQNAVAQRRLEREVQRLRESSEVKPRIIGESEIGRAHV